MDKVKPYIRCAGFLVGLAIIFALCDYVFAPSGYIRYILHQVNDTEENYDTVVVGASHARSAINPQYLVDELGVNAISLAIPGETVRDAYYVIQESCRNNDVKTVIFDVDYQYWIEDRSAKQFYQNFIYNQMEWSSVKLEYLLDNMSTIDIRTAFTKRSSYTITLDGIKNNITTKQSEAYANYSIDAADTRDANGPYIGRGYFYRQLSGTLPGGAAYLSSYIGRSSLPILSSVAEQFEQIKEYCDENGITLICVTSPITPTSVEKLGLEQMHETLSSYFEELGVQYYDFNDTLMSVLPRSDLDYGDQEGHMGGELGNRYSAVLAQLLEDVNEGTYDPSNYFYSSFEAFYENMASDYEKVTGETFVEGDN